MIGLGIGTKLGAKGKGIASADLADGVHGWVLVLDKWTGGTITITPTAVDGTPGTTTGSISYNADMNIVTTNIKSAIAALGGAYASCSCVPISSEPFACAVTFRDAQGLPIVNIASATSATLARVGDIAYGAPAEVSRIKVKGGVATGNFYIYGDTTAGGQALSAIDSQSVTLGSAAAYANTPEFTTQKGFFLARDATVNGPTWSYAAKAVTSTLSDLVIYDPADGTSGITSQITGTALAMVSSGVDGQPTGEDLLHVTNTAAQTGGGFNKDLGSSQSIASYKRMEVERSWGGASANIPFRQGRFRISTDSGYSNHLWQFWDAHGYGLCALAMASVTMPIGWMSRTGSPNLSSMRYTRFTVEANTSTKTDGYFGKVKLLTGKVPKIAFVIDDGYETDYTNVFPVMQRLGLPFSSAIVSSIIGGGAGIDGANPTMTVAMLQEMHESPIWEPLNHTYRHKVWTGTGSSPSSGVSAFTEVGTLQTVSPTYVSSSYNGASPDATAAALLTAEYEDCRDDLEGWGLTKNDGHKHVVYPAGAVNADVVRILEGTDCIAARSTYHWPQNLLPDRIVGPEKYAVRACPSDHDVGFYWAGLNQAMSSGADYCFFFHRTNGASQVAGFTAQMERIADLRNAGLIEVVHFTQLVDGLVAE